MTLTSAHDGATAADSLAPVRVDRDLSWLDFNRRVLAEALDERTPLLERAKFLAIFTSNLLLASGNPDPLEGTFLIGSADWMTRNLSSRVEVVTPVFARGARERLWEVLEVCLRDERQAWLMDSDARYTQLRPQATTSGAENLGTHQALLDLTTRRLS